MKLLTAFVVAAVSSASFASDAYFSTYASKLEQCSKEQSRQKNFKDSEYLRKLANQAKARELQYPERAPAMTVAEDEIAELQSARDSVIRFLDLKMHQSEPELMANVQADYECWMRTSSTANVKSEGYRSSFLSSHAALEEYTSAIIYYSPNGSALSADSKRKLSRLIGTMRANGVEDVAVQSYASTTASDLYNLSLTRRRADVLEKYFRNQGVGINRVILRTYSEGYNANPQGDNKEIQANRRSRVTLVPANTGIK